MNPDDPTDDLDDVLGPDAAADGAERTRARGFADLIDKMMAGRTPAAVPAEDQALLEVATAIRATVRPAELPTARRHAIVEAALATAIDRRGGGPSTSASGLPVVTAGPVSAAAGGVIPLAPRRRALPWLVAGATSLVAAAAITLLVLERRPAATPPAAAAPVARLPVEQRSRPADPLVGAIGREGAGDALGRIDAIYADRLGGFRDRTLSGGRR